MTGAQTFIGIDPGPTTGIVVYQPSRLGAVPVLVAQCSAAAAPAVFRGLLSQCSPVTCVQIERFVIGRGSMRSGRHGVTTRDLIDVLRNVWADRDSTEAGRSGGHWIQRSASEVKPWATDVRLEAAGLLDACKGMGHSRDAARHALFTAVRDGGLPDPLSTRRTA